MNLVAPPLRLKSWLFVAVALLALLVLAGSLLARHPVSASKASSPPLIVVRKSAPGTGRPKVVRALPPPPASTPR